MRIAIDGREFVIGRLTGIARVLSGLIGALSADNMVKEIILSCSNIDAIPESLKRNKKVVLKTLPASFFWAEKVLSGITKNGVHCFISPYPKLPIFATHCPSIHTVHDVLYLTHRAYRKRCRVYLEKFRLKRALAAADLTWYDSAVSQAETEKLMGFSGCNQKVRHLGLDARFCAQQSPGEENKLAKYGLKNGYILVIGNGLHHKNLGILLEKSSLFKRKLIFVGVPKRSQAYWRFLYPEADTIWLNYVKDEDLPVILRNAFCLAQPSTAEGYGYPPLEAMACGVPAVVSDIPVLVETTGGHALVADPYCGDTWLEAIEKLENKTFYGTQVEKGLKWVEPLTGANGWAGHVGDVKEVVEGN